MKKSGKKLKRTLRCYSPNCKGKEVSSTSFYRHKKRRQLAAVTDEGIENEPTEELSQKHFEIPSDSTPEFDFEGVQDPLDTILEDVEGTGFIQGKIPAPSQIESTVSSCLKTQMVLLQADLDYGKVSISLQEKIFKRIFAHNSSTSLESFSIGQLFKHAGSNKEEVEVPNSYDNLLKDYSLHGMVNPVRWRVCTGRLGSPHSPQLLAPSEEDIYEGPTTLKCLCLMGPKLKRNCLNCGEKCSVCKALRKDVLPFDYLPITKQLEQMSSCRTQCHEFLEHWRNERKWRGISPENHPVNITEFWDGSKFRRCQAFWDPQAEWELPVKCRNANCSKVYRAFPSPCKELLDGWNEQAKLYNFLCSLCSTRITCKKVFIQGDPRNFALAGHWDGFLSTTTKFKDSWVVELEVMNGGKNNNLGPIPVIFIPASSEKIIKQSEEQILTAFLEPLVLDLEVLFYEGFDVEFNYPTHLISNTLPSVDEKGKVILRAMLMLWTGDHPAQTKIGGLKDKGYNACRRDKMVEGRLGRSIVYPDNRRQACHPPPIRAIEDIISEVHLVNNTDRRQMCISGVSKLWRLYDFYEFDIRLDLVYDVMHILSLCIFKKYVLKLKEVCHPRLALLDKALIEVTTHKPRDLGARWPNGILDRLGYWKAEEYVLFIQWCLPYVLERMGFDRNDDICVLGLILTEVSRLFFNYTRSYGWTFESLTIAREYLAAWRVRWEEYIGPNGSILEHVAGNGEILDDIVRHGPHDVFWCYKHERKVSSYVNIKTNMKQTELTYAAFYARTTYTSLYKQKKIDMDLLFPPQRAIHLFHDHLMTSTRRCGSAGVCIQECSEDHFNGVFITRSQDAAVELWKLMTILPRCPCKEVLKKKGVTVGWKTGNRIKMGQSVKTYLLKYWRECGLLKDETKQEFNEEIERMSFLILHGTKYRVNDLVVVRPNGTEDHDPEDLGFWTWKGKIVSIFLHEFLGVHEIFFRAKFFEQVPAYEGSNEVEQSDFSFMRLLKAKPKQHFGDDCRPVNMLLHKFMVHPISNRKDVVIAHELCDLGVRFHMLSEGHRSILPPWPEVDKLYWFQKTEGSRSFKIGVVRRVKVPQHLQTEEEIEDMERDEGHPYVGIVYISTLKKINGKKGEFRASIKDSPFSWRCLGEYVTSEYQVTGFTKDVPVTWAGVY